MDDNTNQAKQSLVSNDIFTELGFGRMSEEAKIDLIDTFSNAIQTSVLNRLIQEMDKKEAEEIDNLIFRERWKELDEFLKDKFPNLDAIYSEETTKFLMDLKQQMPDIKNTIEKQLAEIKNNQQ